jgi:hypothetical protein
MDLDGSARRRWFGAAVLAAAAVMLVAGATVLQGRLEGMAFLVYWLGCFVLTMAAIMVAFRDARAVHQITRREHRDLIENTMRNIELEARNRRRGRNDSAP